MKRGNYTAGAMFASFAAGPAFVASIALAAWATSTPTTYVLTDRFEGVGAMLAGSVFVAAFGFVFSVVPNLVGAWFMHGLGIGNFAARLPVTWALTGAGAAGLPFVFLWSGTNALAPLGTAFALTGASCGLIANRFTTWT